MILGEMRGSFSVVLLWLIYHASIDYLYSLRTFLNEGSTDMFKKKVKRLFIFHFRKHSLIYIFCPNKAVGT